MILGTYLHISSHLSQESKREGKKKKTQQRGYNMTPLIRSIGPSYYGNSTLGGIKSQPHTETTTRLHVIRIKEKTTKICEICETSIFLPEICFCLHIFFSFLFSFRTCCCRFLHGNACPFLRWVALGGDV